jgi:steroid delta-isomerase-like uncharacterized protein
LNPTPEHVVRRFYEDGVNNRDWTAVAETLADDFTHNGVRLGPDGQRRSLEGLYAAFPDARVSIEDTVAAGRKVVSRMVWTGTHRGPFLGHPPSGREVSWTAISIIRVSDAGIAEAWVNEDDAGLAAAITAD